jgi:hypothetical protein
MTDQQLRDEAMTLMLAGHETTALALAWSLYLLAGHPAAAARLRAEVGAVLGDRPAAAADLPRLRYADAVVSEAMRLYPPIPVIGRQATERCTVAGYPLPAGGNVAVRLSREGDFLRLEVEDSGIGIAPDDQRRLFERFFRADNTRDEHVPGTGLGLYIARAIVEAHGGEIRVESQLGAGSCFCVELPLVRESS